MKTNTLIAGLAIAILNALVLVPALQANAAYFVAASIAIALWLALKAATSKAAPAAPAEPAAIAPAKPAPAAPAAPAEPKIVRLAEAEAIALLAAFQSKGRLIDFLMDDVAPYSDAQVGAAARVVQQGCKAALAEHFTIEPVSPEKEGAQVTVSAEQTSEYTLVGKVSGEPPFSGTLTHKGWKATAVRLPRALPSQAGGLPPIAPAQVELR